MASEEALASQRGFFFGGGFQAPETIKDPEEIASESFTATGTSFSVWGGSGVPVETFCVARYSP